MIPYISNAANVEWNITKNRSYHLIDNIFEGLMWRSIKKFIVSDFNERAIVCTFDVRSPHENGANIMDTCWTLHVTNSKFDYRSLVETNKRC